MFSCKPPTATATPSITGDFIDSWVRCFLLVNELHWDVVPRCQLPIPRQKRCSMSSTPGVIRHVAHQYSQMQIHWYGIAHYFMPKKCSFHIRSVVANPSFCLELEIQESVQNTKLVTNVSAEYLCRSYSKDSLVVVWCCDARSGLAARAELV